VGTYIWYDPKMAWACTKGTMLMVCRHHYI
jgi:hypothetical protein